METEKKSMIAKSWGSGEGLTIEGFRGILRGDETDLRLDCGNGYATVCIFQNSWNCTLKS